VCYVHVGLDREPETCELARLIHSLARLGLAINFLMIRVTVFARFVNELTRARLQATREP
jgi:hypothetical protein